jgi:hypothetical protein
VKKEKGVSVQKLANDYRRAQNIGGVIFESPVIFTRDSLCAS